MDRREFLARAGLAVTWAGVAVRISACGDEGDDGMGPGGGDGKTGAIRSNHGHAVSITQAQLDAAQAVTLSLDGPGDDHTHTVTLDAGQVSAIAGGNRVQVTSTSDQSHVHQVTFN